ncbi:MAG: ABC transporter permease [Brachymonas sp.]|nr:ABC transporter permease [Brachymonas sp.]
MSVNHAHSSSGHPHDHDHGHGAGSAHAHPQAESALAATPPPEHTHAHTHDDGHEHSHAHVRGHSWPAFFWSRLRRFVVLMSLVAVAAFTLVAASPVDPVAALFKAEVIRLSPEQRERIAEKWGLNDPAPVRFGKWAGNVVQGDLGRSMVYDAPVAKVIAERFTNSLLLMLLAWGFAGVMGFGLGLLAGAWEGSLVDKLIRGYAMILASAPTFWVAIVLLLVFAVKLGWAPICCSSPPGYLPHEVSLWQRLHHLALPVVALSMLGVAQVTLHTRDKVREVMSSDYALLAQAQGLSKWGRAWRHGLRNGALPALTLHFAHAGELFGGSVLAETVFSYPGLGQATMEAGTRGDAALLLGIALFAAVFVFAGNTLADVLARWVDPRLDRLEMHHHGH